MKYPYECACGMKFDVDKPSSDIYQPEECKCGRIAERKIAGGSCFYGGKVEDAEYCPALGCVVRNTAHRNQIARERGLIEVGNEDTFKVSEQIQRDKEEDTKRYYDDVTTDRIVLGAR